MTTKWAHLPNAAHIDRVLASLKLHPKAWVKSYEVTRVGIRDVAYGDTIRAGVSAMNTADDVALNDAWIVAYDTVYCIENISIYCSAGDEVIIAARNAMLALIAYDDSGHLLDSTPEEIKILNALGHPYAILFLPTASAFSCINF